MGLFDKKYCSICGEKIGFLGNRKLEDGNLCKTCARKLSPFFSERRHSTVEEIKEQLAYREANKEKVAAFHPTRTINCREYLILDEDKRQLIVTDSRNWKDENPDVIDFSDVTGCDVDVDESRRELYHKNAEGKNVSYEPKRYEYSYTFNMTIAVNNPYFSEIPIRVNDSEIKFRASSEYHRAEALAEEIRDLLLGIRADTRKAVEAAAAPKKAVVCPYCGATTTPDEKGCCEYCGAPVSQ